MAFGRPTEEDLTRPCRRCDPRGCRLAEVRRRGEHRRFPFEPGLPAPAGLVQAQETVLDMDGLAVRRSNGEPGQGLVDRLGRPDVDVAAGHGCFEFETTRPRSVKRGTRRFDRSRVPPAHLRIPCRDLVHQRAKGAEPVRDVAVIVVEARRGSQPRPSWRARTPARHPLRRESERSSRDPGSGPYVGSLHRDDGSPRGRGGRASTRRRRATSRQAPAMSVGARFE